MPEERARNDRDSRSQWKTLDVASRTRRGLGQSTILSVVRQTPVGPFSPLIAVMVVVVLLGVTLYVGLLVRSSMRESVRQSLQTVLAANIKALDLWIQDQRETVTQLATDPKLHTVAVRLLADSGDASSATATERDQKPHLDALAVRLQDAGYLGWAFLDPFGTVIRSSEQRFQGAAIPLEKDVFESLAASEATVTRPFQLDSTNEALMCAIAPFAADQSRPDLKRSGSIALLIDPAQQFSKILSVAQMGASGETYAFDRSAVMISRSRFEEQLTRAGMLPEGESSPLRIHLRDPQVDIRDTPVPTSDPMTWPITRMADSATRGGDGYDVVGYNDYRGVPVVGAWKWVPEFGFGVATEMSFEEAFASLRILRNSFLALFAAVSIAAGILLVLVWITRPRDNESDRVEELNRRLGQYDLQQRIGRGGMGTVYLGAHGLLDRKVAIKVLENTDATDRSLARFQREVQLSARLKHPNTIEIYDFGRTDEGTFFYVMEFVDGISLEQLVDYYGRQPAERVIYLLMQICGSIAEAHSMSMVHRDIKPANVLLTSRSGIHDLIKVLDFGLAKQVDHDSMQLTRVDSLTGTPLYMSPESIRDAAAADVLSDIYSIGAVGYTMLCGFAPFDGDSSTDVCAKKLHEEPQRPDRRIGVRLAKDLQDVIMRCLKLDPEKRPQSAQQLASELLACVDSPNWTQSDASLWWREVFDGPYLDDFELHESNPSSDGTQGDTAVNEKRPVATVGAQSTAH